MEEQSIDVALDAIIGGVPSGLAVGRLRVLVWGLVGLLGDEGGEYLRYCAAKVSEIEHPGDGPAVIAAAARRVDQ